jgi:plasmid maintenance system antidote protein VapI
MAEKKLPADIKFTVRMLTAYLGTNMDDLAERAGIGVDHLKNVSSGRAKMTADDIVKLSAVTGIPVENIDH